VLTQITINPPAGVPAESAVVAAAGFNPGQAVVITIAGVQVASVSADTTGAINTTVQIPAGSPGSDGVAVNSVDGEFTAQTSFTVNSPSMALDNSSAGPGSTINVSGGGYWVGELVDVSFNGTNVAQATADQSGNISTAFGVPAVSSGTYAVGTAGETSSNTSSETFLVPAPAVDLNTSTGAPGITVTSSGAGYEANETVNVSFNGSVVSTGNADALGNYNIQFTVPQASAGDYPVAAAGTVSNNSASTSFTVTSN